MSRARRFLVETDVTPRIEDDQSASGDRFLILVEGQETERRYLDDLCGRLYFSAYNVVIASPDSDPLNLVWEAVSLRNKEAARAAEGYTVAYDQVWVVFDRESKYHHRLDRIREAIRVAREEGILVAISNPCFELWLILHHEFFVASIPNCDASEKILTKIQSAGGLGDYDKSKFPLEFYVNSESVVRACGFACKLRERHADASSKGDAWWARDYLSDSKTYDSDGNPSTDVDQLVGQLNLAARAQVRLLPYPKIRLLPFTR